MNWLLNDIRQSVAADAWPSISHAASLPWQTASSIRSNKRALIQAKTNNPDSRREQFNGVPKINERNEATPLNRHMSPNLPEFLRNGAVPNIFQSSMARAFAPTKIQNTITSLSEAALYGANPTFRRPFFKPLGSSLPAFARPFSRSSFQISATRAISTTRTIGLNRQSLLGGLSTRNFNSVAGITRNVLASAEELANRNPGNAGQQNTFYQLLLRANMPGILIERYQSGRFATNPQTDEAYRKALAALNMGSSSTSGAMFGSSPDLTGNSGMQGLGNAIAAGAGLNGGNPRGQKGETNPRCC